jgi:hypothetical protein
MKIKCYFLSLFAAAPLFAADSPPPPVSVIPAPIIAPPSVRAVYNYEQKPLPPREPLITPENAQLIIDKFKAAYPKLGTPRFIICVNPGVAGPAEPTTPAKTNPADNLASPATLKVPPLADRQTMRDIERLFGRPLRIAEANLIDQGVATQALAEKMVALHAQDEQARAAREALSKTADVAIEVLISSRNITVPELSGDRIYALPDIQATAIQLKDNKILGQASSGDAMRGNPAYFARNYGVEEITETTALALMEDMLTNVGK